MRLIERSLVLSKAPTTLIPTTAVTTTIATPPTMSNPMNTLIVAKALTKKTPLCQFQKKNRKQEN